MPDASGFTSSGGAVRDVLVEQGLSFAELLVEAIDSRGLAHESIVVFTSDHGEIHFRDNADFHWTHGFQLAPEVLNVALMIRAPGLSPGFYEPVTRSLDILPTLAGLAGLRSAGATARGVNLSAALMDFEPPRVARLQSHSDVPEVLVGRLEAPPRRKAPLPAIASLLEGGRCPGRRLFLRAAPSRRRGLGAAVYNLAADADKRVNLFDPDDPSYANMMTVFVTYKESLTRTSATKGSNVAPVEEERPIELLRSLGYIE